MTTTTQQFAHVQISKQADAFIYVIPVNDVCLFLDQLVSEGNDISNFLLLKVS